MPINYGKMFLPKTDKVENYQSNPKEFTDKYINSKMYKDRLMRSGYGNIDDEIKQRSNNVSRSNTIYQHNPRGSHSDTDGIVTVDRIQAKSLNTNIGLIEAHEYAHKEIADKRGLEETRLNEYDYSNLLDRQKQSKKLIDEYDQNPIENKADMNMLRYRMYLKGIDVMNKDVEDKDINSIINEVPFQRLNSNYKKEDIKWLLNNIAQNKNVSNNNKANSNA